MLNYKKIDKKGQIGETMTWIVATLIIIGVMLLFLFFSLLMSKSKAINVGELKSDTVNVIEKSTVKTSLAEKLNNQNKEIIDNVLKQQNG